MPPTLSLKDDSHVKFKVSESDKNDSLFQAESHCAVYCVSHHAFGIMHTTVIIMT